MNSKNKSIIIIIACITLAIAAVMFVISYPLAAFCLVVGTIVGFTADIDAFEALWTNVKTSFTEVFNFNEGN